MSLRLAVAKQAGLDETLADQIDGYDSREAGDLSDRQRAALRLADALMTQPGAVDAELAAELHRHFSDAQILEITLDVMKWNYQKVLVALGTDSWVVPGELADFGFHDDGRFWVGTP